MMAIIFWLVLLGMTIFGTVAAFILTLISGSLVGRIHKETYLVWALVTVLITATFLLCPFDLSMKVTHS